MRVIDSMKLVRMPSSRPIHKNGTAGGEDQIGTHRAQEAPREQQVLVEVLDAPDRRMRGPIHGLLVLQQVFCVGRLEADPKPVFISQNCAIVTILCDWRATHRCCNPCATS
jgi:hypothetical protein